MLKFPGLVKEEDEGKEQEDQQRKGDQLPPPSLPFLTFAVFLTLGVGGSIVTWFRREMRQRSRQVPQSAMLLHWPGLLLQWA